MDRSICIFGDSVTQADYVEENYVELLRKYLEKQYKDDYIQVYNLGVSGNTTKDILKRFEFESSVRNPTEMIFQIGINDSCYLWTEDKPMVSSDKFESNLKKLIIQAGGFTKNIVFLGLTLGDDSILKPFPGSLMGESYDLARVKKYDKILKEVVEKNFCRFIPLLDKLNFDDFLDGLHPNQNGHTKMFEEIKKYFKIL